MRTRLLLTTLLAALATAAAANPTFNVTYSEKAFQGPFTGKVVIYIGRSGSEPRFGPDWFNAQPVVVASFRNVRPGEPMRLSDANTESKPHALANMTPGEYAVQAVIDRNLGGRQVGVCPGNLHSETKTVRIGAGSTVVDLVCDRVIPEPTFKDTAAVKGVKIQSRLLTAFYHRPTYMKAAVVLPKNWAAEPQRRFPVVYEFPGFGGNSQELSGMDEPYGTEKNGEPFIVVLPNPDCPTGYCAFADSANNGPWGKALTSELIPYIEKTYRAVAKPWARFVAGHSSGGWTSLWLQVAYPDFFGGTWSTSPDPVDFRTLQGIDIYKPGTNMFTDEQGKPRPLARFGSVVAATYRAFSDREWGLRGEQLGSFEGVFSPRGADGEPAKLWSRATGAINPKVAKTWRAYDIDYILRTNWTTLGPKLKGKLFVVCGTEDTFYLDSAVRSLQKDLKALHSDAVVELRPGDHGSVLTRALRDRIEKEMAAKFRANKSVRE